MSDEPTDDLITSGAAAEIVGVSASWLRRIDHVLRPIKPGARASHRWYRRSAIVRYAALRDSALAARRGGVYSIPGCE